MSDGSRGTTGSATPTVKELREKWEAARDATEPLVTLDPLARCARQRAMWKFEANAAAALIAAYEARVGELEERVADLLRTLGPGEW